MSSNTWRNPQVSRFNDVSLKRGDVVWTTLSQTLSHVSKAGIQAEKPRPFIILKDVDFREDFNHVCQSNALLLGVTGTSQEILTEGRPHISFMIPSDPQHRMTYVHTDTFLSVHAQNKRLQKRHTLTPAQLQMLDEDLGKVLMPEKRFFFRQIARKQCYPGEIWHVETASHSGSALILLKRGSFTLTENFNAAGEEVYGGGPSTKTPYLVMFFDKPLKGPTLQGVMIDDVTVMPVHEGSLIRKESDMGHNTAGNIVNMFRRQIGLPPMLFEKHTISDLTSFLTHPFGLLSFGRV